MAKQPFTYKITIQAENQAEAVKIMEALSKLPKVIDPNDLALLANAIEKKPGLVKTALKYL